MIKHFLKTYYQGTLFPNTTSSEVEKRDVLIEMPVNAYAYQYFDLSVTNLDGEELKGTPKNYSPMYFKGEVFTLKQVEEMFPEHRTLISNMKGNKYPKVVKTYLGNFQPFNDKDILV